ncbi:acyl-CoA dehydrogenase [Nocardia camponoti]|uniref:Acyl-CoA dehydrogenase n=1 Tax=Nocardia camponoti TaxID=1616106 RepID=A0A917QNP5_9NOCA|nr:acyl-CoA dehydrogenase [Nocardia camponoti]GGK59962.1 acyl-CoA dehydrogenase [Nocardia camponoti]
MTIATTDEHKAAAASLRSWAKGVTPIATTRVDGTRGWRKYWDGLTEFGLFSVALAESSGGLGGTVADLAVMLEQTADDLVGGPVLPTALGRLVANGVVAEGDPCAVALTGDASATPSDAGWVVSGRWEYVYGADEETQVLVPAGEQWFLLPAEQLEITVVSSADRTIGLAHVVATDVFVPAASTFAPEFDVEDLFVVLASAELAGIAGWALRTAVDYAKVREQFGKPIGSFQSIKHLCAWMLCRAELAQAVAADAAAAFDTDELPIAAAVAAAVALDAAVDNVKDAIQVLGGIGFTWEHDAHFYLRRAGALRQLLGGSSRWRARVAELSRAGQRRTTGARQVLGDQLDDATLAAEVAAIARLPTQVGAVDGPAAGQSEIPAEADQTGAEAAGRSASSQRDALVTAGLLMPDADQAGAEAAGRSASPQRDALVKAGLLMPHWPKPYGREADPLTSMQIAEALRVADIEVPELAVAGWAIPTLLKWGTPEQVERFVWPTLHGDVTWCQLFSEPGAGSDLAALRTTAERVDGGWVLRGQKVWTSLGSVADWGICLARTDQTVAKHRGISYFLVDMRAAGVNIRPLIQITGEDRFSEVFLDDVFVPDDDLVGGLGDGWKIARTTLSAERVAMGGGGIGGALEALLAAFGPDSELREDRFGAFIASQVAGTLLDQRIALATVAGADAGAQASVRKLVGVRHRQDLAEYAWELTGFAGATETPELKEFLLTRCLSIAGGTEQILLTMAAERILGLPRES